MVTVNLSSFKVTEYLPNYMWIDEVHFEYDFINHRYRVNGSEWKIMSEEKENRIKKRYKIIERGNNNDSKRIN